MKKIVNSSGKRKKAIARATIKAGKGRIRINKIPLELYSTELVRLKIQEPLAIASKKVDKVDINIKRQIFCIFLQGALVLQDALRLVWVQLTWFYYHPVFCLSDPFESASF